MRAIQDANGMTVYIDNEEDRITFQNADNDTVIWDEGEVPVLKRDVENVIIPRELYLRERADLRAERLIEELGQSTMEIYLLHGYVVSAFRIIITRIGLLDDFGIVPLLACSVTGVVIPMIMYRIVKRIKIVDFCFYPQRYIMYKEKDSIR